MASPHGFSVPGLEKRLKELNTTLKSIQGLSQWAIHNRKHAKTVVSVWYKDLQKGVGSPSLGVFSPIIDCHHRLLSLL